MPVEKNLEDLWNCYAQNHEIKKIMYGEALVWEANQVINLGSGTEWDIKSLLPNKYNKFTADNFYFFDAGNVSGSAKVVVTETGIDVGYLSISVGLTKRYDSETGKLVMYTTCNQGRGNVTAVFVSKPNKLISLGSGATFDLKSLYPNSYQKFTEGNFIMKRYSTGLVFNQFRGSEGTWTASNTQTYVKSYNQSTGILTCRMDENVVDSYTGQHYGYKPCEVYLLLGKTI